MAKSKYALEGTEEYKQADEKRKAMAEPTTRGNSGFPTVTERVFCADCKYLEEQFPGECRPHRCKKVAIEKPLYFSMMRVYPMKCRHRNKNNDCPDYEEF